jgi:hypothetical protein
LLLLAFAVISSIFFSGCRGKTPDKSVILEQDSNFIVMDISLQKYRFDSETFYERYQAACKDGHSIVVIISERPFCDCFGDKEILTGVTLNAYNSSATELLKKINQKYPDTVETILIDLNSLKNDQLAEYIDLKDQLGLSSTPAVVVLSSDGSVVYLSVEKIIHNEVINVLDHRDDQ